MSDKKHIDRLFQEKLKDFEATPNDAIWDNISHKLNKDKEDRKVIPFWWKLAGVAATLLLLLTVGNLVLNNSSNTIKVVETEKVHSDDIKEINKNRNVAEKENLKESTDESPHESSQKTNKAIQPEALNKNKGIVNSEKSGIQKNLNNPKSNQTKYQNKKATNSTNYTVNVQTNEVPKSDESTEHSSNIDKNNTKETSLNQSINTEVVVENKTDKSNVIEKNTTKDIIFNNEKENQSVVNNKEEKTPTTENLTFKNKDLIENEEKSVVIDEEKEKTPLTEDVIVSNENIREEEKGIINRWQVNPNIAPVYFNSFGKGSPIHEQLINNEKSGSVNMSYGVNISYAVNSKLSIKSGVNKVDLGYNTNDVIIYENIGASNGNTGLFKNIELNNSIQDLSFVSGSEFGFAQSPSIVPNESMALLSQEMTYFEIPLELKYNLSERKLGFELVGGFSTFVLSNNKVSYEIRGVNKELGEATNLNDVSYSINFGFGLNYKIVKNINLNIDPMFKYQINTFNNTSGSFKPYVVGIYTGLNYKF